MLWPKGALDLDFERVRRLNIDPPHIPRINLHNLMQMIEVVEGAQDDLVVECKTATIGGATGALPDRLIIFRQGRQ